jgi:hypothetical protein
MIAAANVLVLATQEAEEPDPATPNFRTRLFIQLRPMLGRAPSIALQALAGVKPWPQPRQRSESL